MRTLLFDFSKVLLFPKDENYHGSLNKLYRKIQNDGKNFNDHYRLNTDLLNYLSELNCGKYIFTTGTVQNAPEIKGQVAAVFNDIFNVPLIGFEKTDKRAYLDIAERVGVEPNELLFIDDNKDNLKAAKEEGLDTLHYEDNEQVKSFVNNWLE